MGRYKRDLTFYNNRWQRTEDLIADAYTFAQRKPAETIEIAAHLMSQAFEDQDDALMDVARDLMRVAGSPCRFKAEENSDKATDTNNRPSEPIVPDIPADLLNDNEIEDEEWDDTFDYIFDERVRPQEIKRTIETVKSEKVKDRRFHYVAYRILKVIKWIPVEISESEYLRWINCHFECGWEDNKNQKKAFLFNLEGTVKKLDDLHPSEWKDDSLYGKLGKHYRLLAISFKNAFTYTMIDKKPVVDSESYEHLKDRVEFLSGAREYHGALWAPDEAYINDGK